MTMAFRKKFKAVQIDTLVGPMSKVVGDVYYGGGLQIEGTVEGNVMAKSEDKSVLVISEMGVVEGEIRGTSIIIDGTVHGDIYASEGIELKAGAKINGDIYYTSLGMTVGAEVNGKLVCQPSPNPPDTL
ncbi:MAG: polymer-forming cytoskeletal protein [Proteobacteria bacterium]|nr:polymer-forming cytoskeletal protein [Pseudomonadota bacterium]